MQPVRGRSPVVIEAAHARLCPPWEDGDGDDNPFNWLDEVPSTLADTGGNMHNFKRSFEHRGDLAEKRPPSANVEVDRRRLPVLCPSQGTAPPQALRREEGPYHSPKLGQEGESYWVYGTRCLGFAE